MKIEDTRVTGSVVMGGFLLGILLPAGAFEVGGVLVRADPEAGIVEVQANGQNRRLPASADFKLLDPEGNLVAEGLASPALNPGVVIRMNVERGPRGPVLKQIRLGGSVAPPLRERPSREPPGPVPAGLKPLCDMTADDRYKGEDGGLYGGGRNRPPPVLQAAAEEAIARIVPRDPAGNPAADGRIGLVSISMSNATQEFSVFKQMADRDPRKSPSVVIVDCAQGGQAMAEWTSPHAPAWQEADRRIRLAGLSHAQVQAGWIKIANKGPRGDLPEHGRKLQADTEQVILRARERFPHLQIVYLSSRIYGGFATTALNPEPYAYEGGFVARWLILDPLKNKSLPPPIRLWGPYLWSTTSPRSDGLLWERADFAADGTHPSESGRRKVANLLLTFFAEDPLASPWFSRR